MSPTLLAPSRAAVRPSRRMLAEPAGLPAWRAAAAASSALEVIAAPSALRLLKAVRDGSAMAEVVGQSGLPRERVLDVVSGVGGRLGQANKSGRRASRSLSSSRGRLEGLGPGLHVSLDRVTVVMGEGWARSRQAPRDVSSAYAAIVVSDPAGDAVAVDLWLGRTCADIEVTYAHMAHLFAVAHGTFATLEGLTPDMRAQGAYLRAFDALASSAREAQRGLAVVLDPRSTAAEIYQGTRSSFWMMNQLARPVAAAAAAAAAAPSPATERTLRALVARVRLAVERAPRKFFPGSLADLTKVQFRALCVQAGFVPPSDDEGTREDAGQHALEAALRRQQLLLSTCA